MNSISMLNQNLIKKDLENKNVNEQLKKLSNLLNYCNYNYSSKVQITKNIQDVLRVLPLVRVELLQFYEQFQLKRYIQLNYYIEKLYFPTITLFIMLNQRFPDQPPFLRIINPNISIYVVEKQFIGLKSSSDPNSILLNSVLTSIKQWKNNKSLVNTLLQAQTFIKSHFPYERKDQVRDNYAFWGNYNRNSTESLNKFNAGNNNANIMNYANNFNNNNNYINNMNNANNMNNNMNNNNNLGNSKNNIFIYNAKPVFKPINEDAIVKGQIYFSNNKQKLLKTKNLYDKCLENTQKLDIYKNSLHSQSYRLAYQIKTLQLIINQQSQTNLLTLVKPADEFSQNLLQLMSSIRARLDKSIFIQEKFYTKEISFENFMKISRKNEEQKFEQIFLVQHLLKYSQSKRYNI